MNTDQAFNILDLPASATTAQIAEAHRHLASVWRPEQFGADPKLRARAEDTLKQIDDAFEFLQAARAQETAAMALADPRPWQSVSWWVCGLIALVIINLLLSSLR